MGVVAALIFASSIIPSTDAFVVPAARTAIARPNTNNKNIIPTTTKTPGEGIMPASSSSSSYSTTSSSLRAIRRGGGRRPDGGRKVAEFVPLMNDEIKQTELRVNVSTKDGKDESLGIMSKAAALAKAKELGGLDLILINDNSVPPVCKIADYSKYRYSQEKKRKEKAKNSKATEIKEVKMSYIIGDHDYDVRLKAAMKFIKQGNRVKATVQFRGREVQHDNLGVELLVRLATDLEDMANMEGKPRREGRTLGAILTPRAEVVKALNDAKRLREREKKKAREESLKKRMDAMDAKQLAAMAAGEGGMAGGIQGLLDELELEMDDDDDDDDDDMDDDDFDDADLDELLGSSKIADDLFA
jgi:translation initiation factor IF-3